MKNYIIGIVLLLAAGFLMLDPLQWQPRAVPVDDAPNEPDSPADASQSAGTPPSIEPESAETQVGNTPDENASSALSETTPITLGEEKLNYALENDYSLPVFTNHMGGIREVRLKEQGRLSKDYNMTHEGEPLLSLALEDENGREYKSSLPDPRAFRLVPQTDPAKILYQWELAGQLRVEREYTREANSTYVILHETRITNLGKTDRFFERIKFNLGDAFRIPRLYNPFDSSETYLNVGYYNAGIPLAEGCSCAECSGRIDGEE